MNVPDRCNVAGIEIEEKMMKRNGFTAEEATTLIGAHTIGSLRFTFGGLGGPWVTNGKEDFTPTGPIFDNAFFDFLDNVIEAKTAFEFEDNIAPFTRKFGDWYEDSPRDLQYIDTDIAIAFPPARDGHPDYHAFTATYAKNNILFLLKFFTALSKMSKLGVTDPLELPGDCRTCPDPTTTRLLRGGKDGHFLKEDYGEYMMLLHEKDEDIVLSQRQLSSSPLSSDVLKLFLKELTVAIEEADKKNEAIQDRREKDGEIAKMTKPDPDPKNSAADPNDSAAQAGVDALAERREEAAVQAEVLLELDVSVLGNKVPVPHGSEGHNI